MLKKVALIALFTSSTLLGGCVSTGPMNGFSREPMSKVVVWKNPDYGQLTDADYRAVTRQVGFCQTQVVDQQVSGALESELTMGAAYGLAGAAGVGGGARAGGIGSFATMGPYGAVAGAANGFVAGATQHSSNEDYLVGFCASTNMSDPASKIGGVHVGPSFIRTKNKSDKPPSWVIPAPPEDPNGEFIDTHPSDDSAADTPPPPPH